MKTFDIVVIVLVLLIVLLCAISILLYKMKVFQKYLVNTYQKIDVRQLFQKNNCNLEYTRQPNLIQETQKTSEHPTYFKIH